MIFVVLWAIIFLFLALYLGRSPKVQGWLKVLSRNRRIWRASIIAVVVVAAIVTAYLLVPATQQEDTDDRRLFEAYAAQAVMKLDSLQKIKVDSACDLSRPEPELAYILPLVIASYEEIVDKPTLPLITRLDDTLYFVMNGYKQFRNRGSRLNKLLLKKLGGRYSTSIKTDGSTRTLRVTYTGTPWDIEQLASLPVLEAARIYHVDPALLMSLIRHVSNFDFDYRGQKDARGILALDRGEGLEQIFIGADRLSKLLEVGISQENAIASFYPDPAVGAKPENWSKSPLTKSWVNQVLGDVEFYRANGL